MKYIRLAWTADMGDELGVSMSAVDRRGIEVPGNSMSKVIGLQYGEALTRILDRVYPRKIMGIDNSYGETSWYRYWRLE